jgi:hypothetical protein
MEPANDKIAQLIKTHFPLNCKIVEFTTGHFNEIKNYLKKFVESTATYYQAPNKRQRIKFYDTGSNQCELQLGDDTLWFHLHPNLFRISPDNPAYRYSYLRDDEYRSRCAVIHVYNFLSDSLAERRSDDYGMLIARIFVNYENHFMVEGRKQLGMLFNDISNDILTEQRLNDVLEQVILFCLQYDLFAQPFDQVPAMSYREISSGSFGSAVASSKQLGFKLKAEDHDAE